MQTKSPRGNDGVDARSRVATCNQDQTTYENGEITIIESDERKHVHIGQDKQAAHHHLVKHERKLVVVRENGTIEHVERWDDVDHSVDELVTRWMAFIEEKRGWERRNYITVTQFFGRGLKSGFRTLGEVLDERGEER